MFFAVRWSSLYAQIASNCPLFIVIFRQISPALLHGLQHFPSPNIKLVDEVGLACSLALTILSKHKDRLCHVANTGQVADQKKSAGSRSALPQTWESAIIPKSEGF
jgi:hypothetical protein